MKTTKTTIYDVAEAANVSITTISDVLNKKSRVSENTANRVKEAMKRLNYTPRQNKLRNSDSKKKYNQIAFLVCDTNPLACFTPLSETVFKLGSELLEERDTQLILCHLTKEGKLPQCIQKNNVDGVIVRGGNLPNNELKKLEKLPCVFLLNQPYGTNLDSVYIDDMDLAFQSFDYFKRKNIQHVITLELEQENIAFHSRKETLSLLLKKNNVTTTHITQNREDGLENILSEISELKNNNCGLFIPGYNHLKTPSNVDILLKSTLNKEIYNNTLSIVTNGENLNHDHLNIDFEKLASMAFETLLWRLENKKSESRKVALNCELITN